MQCLVQTPCGPIQGIPSSKAEGVRVFRGVRYATAERFAYPQVVTSWEGTYDATQFGNCSFQPRAFHDETQLKPFYYHEFREGEHYDYAEDCLFLNIWAPEDARYAPVLLYIHGGGFTGGCGFEKHFEGEAWCKRGVILITINYRLGPLGFFCHPWLEHEAGHTGNYAFYDQVAALDWVRNNIAAFGGDPEHITLMGQSAGAMSVQTLCLSPLTEGKICGAIMLSGGGVSKLMNAGTSVASDNYGFYEKVAAGCGAHTLADLRRVDPQLLYDTFARLKKEEKNAMGALSPLKDGILLTESGTESKKAGHQHAVPYLLTTTSEDIVPPIVFEMARDWCNTQAAQGKCPSYQGFFKRQLPGDDMGAFHSSDLWYAFGTLANAWRPFAEEDYALSDAMVGYYSNFAKTGNPNGEGLPEWRPSKKGQKEVMVLDAGQVGMGRVPMVGLVKTMIANPGMGE